LQLTTVAPDHGGPRAFLAHHGGIMGPLIEAYDWASTPVGPIDRWPRALKTAVGLILQARQPAYVAWGPEQISFYNDGYIPILGSKHPAGLGQPAKSLWSEIWDTLGPMNAAVLSGQAQWFEDMPFALAGRDRPVSWFSFSYTPLRDDDDRIAGIFCVATETTGKVLAERRAASERERLTRMFEQAPGFMAVLEGPEHRFVHVNPAYRRLVSGRDVVGRTVKEALPETVAQGYLKLLDDVYRTGNPYISSGARFLGEVSPGAEAEEHFLDFVYQPMTDVSGSITGIFIEGYEVTQRVRAESSLRASEERYRTLFEAIDEGFGLMEPVGSGRVEDFRLVATNPAFATTTGLDSVVGATLTDLLGEDAISWIGAFADVLSSGRARWQRRLESTGRILDVFAYRLDEEPTHRVAALVNDITARVQAETDRLALLKLSDAIRGADDPDELSYTAARILGETLGVSRAGYGTVDTRAETIRIDRDWNAPGVASIAGTLRFRDYGSYIDDLKRGETAVVTDARQDPRTARTARTLEAISARSFINMPVTEQGDFVALLFFNDARAREWTADELALVREFAERTRTAVARLAAERDLRHLAASLEQQVEQRTAERDRIWRNSRDLLVVVDGDGVFRTVNPAWTAILGHSPQEVVGRSFLDFVWPDDADLTRSGFAQAAKQADLTDFETRYRHKDGTPRWISWHTTAEGDLVYAYGRDVTAAKQAAAELAQAQEALRQAQKLEAIGQLTGGVAHDFNNLLTIIKSSSDLLRRPDLPEERRRKYIDAISETVSRAAKLTGQLLAFARRQALKPEVFDVAQRVRDVADMLSTVVGSRIQIVLDVADQSCWTKADASQFETALVNLVVNARDAMDGEGMLSIKVSATYRSASEEFGRQDGKAFVTVSIADTGVGIPTDRLTKIFEPFFTTKEVGKGTGLGLSQVYGFAKQSGGDVAVESKPGKGSIFSLYLPAAEQALASSGEPKPVMLPHHGAGRRVLVVEDNVDVGAFSTQVLQDLGYETIWAKSAKEAMSLIEDGQPFDVVFSDVVMPETNGIDLAKTLRERYPTLPIVLTSGYSDVLAEKGRHGFSLLQKPYAAEELSRVLRLACAGSRMSRAPLHSESPA
jgi:PAS domain S-box-containing protein